MYFMDYIIIASGLLSTTYGYGERFCGDIGKPVACDSRATTSSGIPLTNSLPIIAVAAPSRVTFKAHWVRMKADNKKCAWLLLADKMNPRYVGNRGFDLTPEALRRLSIKPHKHWSGTLTPCFKGQWYKPYIQGKEPQ